MSCVRCEDCGRIVDTDFVDQNIDNRCLCANCQFNYDNDGTPIEKCSNCGGSGKTSMDSDGTFFACEDCDGRGYIRIPESKEVKV